MAVTWKRIAYQDELHSQNTDTALGAQTENLDMSTHKVVGVVDPTTDQEAATKKYVDDSVGGAHDIASHSDTTATGAELDTLTDNSIADTLHRHSELTASDGSPDPAVSADADGIVDMPYQSGCRVYLAGDQTITTGVNTKLLLATEDWDTQGEFADNKFTTKKAGKYLVSASTLVLSLDAGKIIRAEIWVNGAVSRRTTVYCPTTGTHPLAIAVDILDIQVDDYIELYIFHNQGSDRTAGANALFNYMSIVKIA